MWKKRIQLKLCKSSTNMMYAYERLGSWPSVKIINENERSDNREKLYYFLNTLNFKFKTKPLSYLAQQNINSQYNL